MKESEAAELCHEAVRYIAGDGVLPDKSKARELFSLAAETGFPNALFGLAELTVREDPASAKDLYRRASDKGHMPARYRLADLLIMEGTDLEEARKLMGSCAESSFPPAYTSYADVLFYGVGGEQNMSRAFDWYLRGAYSGDPVAKFKCGYLLESGTGVSKDVTRAIEMFRSSAEDSLPEAMMKMATLAEADMVPGGKKEAIKWYERCITCGYPAAAFNLATLYYQGEGEFRNLPEAFRLYKSVGDETNDGDALFMTARMYMEGLGTEKNVGEALIYMGKAADAGNQQALQFVNDIRRLQNTQFVTIEDPDE